MSSMKNSEVCIRSSLVNVKNLFEVINACLPKQGAIEVQHDQEGKEHSWHTHETDETIVVLEGKLQFYWEGGKEICQAGDVIELPRGTKHGSIALDSNAKYIIIFEHIDLT